MLEYNLTQRERQIMVQLLELSKNSKEHFLVHIVNVDATGPARELAELTFKDQSDSMELTRRDLCVLKDEGLIHFRWQLPDHGMGRLSSIAFEAVDSGFGASEDSAGATANAAAAEKLTEVAEKNAISRRFQRITTLLVHLTRELIDADEALAAQNDADAIAEELAKPTPDEALLTRKIKGFVSRLSLTFSSTADLAVKGEMIGEFGERLAGWLVAVSIWTEWHTAHHHAADTVA